MKHRFGHDCNCKVRKKGQEKAFLEKCGMRELNPRPDLYAAAAFTTRPQGHMKCCEHLKNINTRKTTKFWDFKVCVHFMSFFRKKSAIQFQAIDSSI
jgi:hypothetical protein